MNKLILLVCTVLMAGCTATTKEELTESGLKRSDFQTEVNGEKTDLFVLKNKNKMEVCVTNFGGRIVSVMVPDKDGNMKDVVLGFDSIQDYIKYPSDFGASIGRYANRINQGRFTLDGVEYQLPQNNYGHCLHGGSERFPVSCVQRGTEERPGIATDLSGKGRRRRIPRQSAMHRYHETDR